MKLLHGGLSPFVRKVMIVVHEKGLAERIALEPSPVNPLEPFAPVIAVNPLGKIPALITDDGQTLYGSTVIAEYLDSLLGAPQFFPAGAERWAALRKSVLADGLLDAGNLIRIEGLRPEGTAWDKWLSAQNTKVSNALDALEGEAADLAVASPAIGEISLVCALGWLDVRLPQLEWRTERPVLANWFAEISQRDSIARTAPKLPT